MNFANSIFPQEILNYPQAIPGGPSGAAFQAAFLATVKWGNQQNPTEILDGIQSQVLISSDTESWGASLVIN